MHVISNLGIGGAELSLCALVEQTQGKEIDHVVISLLPNGALRPRLELAGARVIELAGQRGLAGALLLPGLGGHIASAKPDIVHSWMYHSNIAAIALRELRYFSCPLIWSIRQGLDNPTLDSGLTRALIWLGARLSAHPEVVVYNSDDAARTHEAIGYAAGRRLIIYNGVDCHRFKPQPDARSALRAQLDLAPGTILIGRVARYSPMKDFDTLLGAFRKALNTLPFARLLLVGTDISQANQQLVALCRRHGCLDQVLFMGPRLDIEQVYPALDLLVSSSSANEGFPNVVAEALASGTLVASTSSGQSDLIHGGAHRVVPPRNEDALCEAMVDLAGLALTALGAEEIKQLSGQGRRFVEANFSIDAFAQTHLLLYQDLLGRSAVAPHCLDAKTLARDGDEVRN
ncbi:glycosyltransferase [Bradyrhizobium sp.]|uniref:glycosyltransferase n=1 Tax=Bradyrhizobium sp. TaxID=376 RepID=UPI003C5BA8B1